jgi:serine/threonine protein kinase
MDLSYYHPSDLFHTEEKLSKYRPGGYHPVCLGDTFKDDRYKIYHKLGWGGFSTVWLAKDRECAHRAILFVIFLTYIQRHNQWVSLKIITADSSKGSRELLNLQLLEKRSQGSLCSKYIVQLLDSFVHQGPNGQHQCLVFELLGPTVDRVLEAYNESQNKLETRLILRMSKQLLEAIKFIHDAGMGHGGNAKFYLLFSIFYIH